MWWGVWLMLTLRSWWAKNRSMGVWEGVVHGCDRIMSSMMRTLRDSVTGFAPHVMGLSPNGIILHCTTYSLRPTNSHQKFGDYSNNTHYPQRQSWTPPWYIYHPPAQHHLPKDLHATFLISMRKCQGSCWRSLKVLRRRCSKICQPQQESFFTI